MLLLRLHAAPEVACRSLLSARRLRGRLHAVGVKAFERMKLTNVRNKVGLPPLRTTECH